MEFDFHQNVPQKSCFLVTNRNKHQGKRANLKTGVPRKQCTRNFLKNEYFLPTDTYTCLCVSECKKCLFFGKFGALCFRVRFAFLPYYRRFDFKQGRCASEWTSTAVTWRFLQKIIIKEQVENVWAWQCKNFLIRGD